MFYSEMAGVGVVAEDMCVSWELDEFVLLSFVNPCDNEAVIRKA